MSDLGVVLLHGKMTFLIHGGRSPDHLAALAAALTAAGHRVATPVMPWSPGRVYSSSYEEAMDEIEGVVRELGSSRVVIGGHSLGANAAIGYAARKGGVAGVMAFAPGQCPELPVLRGRTGSSVHLARTMVADGRGADEGTFADFNMGKDAEIVTTAESYLSYFDPDGPAVIPRNVERLQPGTALLWVASEEDRLTRRGPGYAFDLAPADSRNRYAELPVAHVDVPTAAVPIVLDWIRLMDRVVTSST